MSMPDDRPLTPQEYIAAMRAQLGPVRVRRKDPDQMTERELVEHSMALARQESDGQA